MLILNSNVFSLRLNNKDDSYLWNLSFIKYNILYAGRIRDW
jgi:hypothetical protein